MKKIIKLTTVITLCILTWCCQHEMLPNNNGEVSFCDEAYVAQSIELSSNLYKGTVQPRCFIVPIPIHLSNVSYGFLCKNPNNQFEFCYLKYSNTKGTQALCVYNVISKQEKVLTDKAWYDFNWGSNNWILFTGRDIQLYKIKSNGDSLTQLTNTNNYNNQAKWSPDGSRYVYLNTALSKFQISDYNGVKLDTFMPSTSMWRYTWYDNDNIIFVYELNGWLHVKLYNVHTKQITLLHNIQDVVPNSIYKYKEEVCISAREGIYLIKNNTVSLIEKNYDSFFGIHCQHLNDNCFLLNRVLRDTTKLDSCMIPIKNYIGIYDITTKKERELLLPE